MKVNPVRNPFGICFAGWRGGALLPARLLLALCTGLVFSTCSGALNLGREPLGPCSRLTPLVISEIMYKPAPRADTNNLEYIEIFNSNPYFEDISGYRLLGNNLNYTFPPGTILGGGAFLVVAASPGSIANIYGITNVVGPYSGTLKSSDTVQLLDDIGAILLTVPYASQPPWPMGAQGSGHSLVLANPTYGEGDPRAWAVSDLVGGAPGMMDGFGASALRSVRINEVLAHSENTAVSGFVELYNHSNATNDLSGCILTDDPLVAKLVLPPGTLIGPASFLSFDASQLTFSLQGGGGVVYLMESGGQRILDVLPYEAQSDGVSAGRWPDGADAIYPLSAPSPGASNRTIHLSPIVINELMYDPISGNDDDQYIELYNQGTNPISLADWQFTSGVSFRFSPGTVLAPDGYLVVAKNLTNLLAKYSNLNAANTVGNFGGHLSHKGEQVVLAMPQPLVSTNVFGRVTNIIYVAQDEVTYEAGGRWGQWAHGGGSSLELINPNTNHRLAYNWSDSDETSKSIWTNIEYTGVLGNGANYSGASVNQVQLGLMDVGECLVDDIEVRPGGPDGMNIVYNGDFELGLASWNVLGDHRRSGLETAAGFGGFQSLQSLHLRSSDGLWTLGDYAQGSLTQTTLGNGQTATLRLKARWLRGWPELLMRLRGNWLEVSGAMPVPPNLGTPGARNSSYVANPASAIYEVKHAPALPTAYQALVVTARFHSTGPFQPTVLYRVDQGVNPAPTYSSVPMVDDGTGGDAIAGDGLFSATIPGQPSGTVVAFLVQADSTLGSTSVFPADLKDNAGVPRECVVRFGDTIPAGNFGHHHIFLTQNWINRWAQGGGVSHELYDGTWVDSSGRIIYNWKGRYAGSPYHQYLGSPVTTLGGMHWIMPEDDQVFGTTSFNKQHVPGNGALDDTTLQREQTCFWMAHRIGLPRATRRYYALFVNGNRHGPLMEDSQVPGAEMIKQYWPNDDNGWLFKNHSWFEGEAAPQSNGYMSFENKSWCYLGRWTTTINGVPNQYVPARYRWMWWIRQWPGSANDLSQVYALLDAANTPTTDATYYAKMESQVDTEEWLRMSAMEHASGDWDSFFTQNQWNMYCYKPTMGKWTALKWDWNIALGNAGSWGSDGAQLFNAGPNDPTMAAFHRYPPYRRAYLRALQDIANLAMNNAAVNPVLDAKYAAFVASGLSVTDPGQSGGLKSWIGTMHNSILNALVNQGVSSVSFAINSVTVSNNLAIITGTAPLAARTLSFNGSEWPLTWTTVTNWTAYVPLQPGSNLVSVVGLDLRYQPIAGLSNVFSAVVTAPSLSPAGQLVINEVMANPSVTGAEFVELYNNSAGMAFDVSGWQLPELGYTFPAGSLIQSGSYIVLADNRSAFATAYGGGIPIFDAFNRPIPTNGQPLLLVKPGANGTNDLIVAGTRVSGGAPWPAAPAGSSFQVIDPSQDNWRPGNWAIQTTNSSPPAPAWRHVTCTGTAPRPILLICIHGAAGDVYVDDLKLVAGSVPESGSNLLQDGDFESGLAGPWTMSANMTNSSLNTAFSHSGNASLHVVATSPGDAISQAIWQATAPIVTNGIYTLSFWCLPGTNATQLLIRLSGSAPADQTLYSLTSVAPPSLSLTDCTPGAVNSVRADLPMFPPLWLNELQAFNDSGITNSAGQHAPWLELYNPTTNAVSLAGLFLSTNYADLTLWSFPAGAVINPGEFKIVFADGATNLSSSGELHTPFRLSPTSGSLALSRVFNGSPQVLDYIDYTNLGPNHSYGSQPDGQSFFRQEFFYPSPGGTNSGATPFSFVPYATAGASYEQSFDSLPNPGADSVNADNPVTLAGVTYALSNPFDFAGGIGANGQPGGLGVADLAGWYGNGSLMSKFGANSGDQTTGGIISFGAPGSGNRALGLLATSSTGATRFGVKFVNETLTTLDQLSVQVKGAVWRQSNLPKTLQCYYTIDPTGTASWPLPPTGYLPGLDVAMPVMPLAVGGIAVDGTLPENQTNLAVVQKTIANWPPGAALWLCWQMNSTTGHAQGLGIDDLSFSASQQTSVSAPLSVTTTSTNLVISWPSVSGLSYQLQYKDDLLAPSWLPLREAVPGTGSAITITNDFSESTQRFYRLQIVPANP